MRANKAPSSSACVVLDKPVRLSLNPHGINGDDDRDLKGVVRNNDRMYVNCFTYNC